jgi:hypothetical protein
LHLDNARSHLSDHEIQANHLTRLSHPPYNPHLAPADFWLFEYLKIMPQGSSFETVEELREKVTDMVISILTSIFR